jgi:uncharacterized membrane protein
MYIAFKEFHSYLAYITLALLLFAIVFNAYYWLKGRLFSKTNKSVALWGLIAVHTQFLAGLILYFLSPLGISNFSADAMKVSITRLYLVEHPLVMLLAIVLITIGYSKANKVISATSKYKTIVIFYSIGLCFILSRIPWSVWV